MMRTRESRRTPAPRVESAAFRRWTVWLSLALVVVPAAIGPTANRQRLYAILTGSTIESRVVVLARASILAMIAIVVLASLLAQRRGALQLRAPVVAVVSIPWLIQAAGVVVRGEAFGLGILAYPVVAAAVLVTRPRIEDLGRIGGVTAAIATISVVLGVIRPEVGAFSSALAPPGFFSKAWFDSILVWPFGHPNELGSVLALGLPWLDLVRSRVVRALGRVAVVGAVVWSNSRVALAAVVAVIVVHLIARRHDASRRGFSARVIFAVLAFGGVLPFMVHDPQAFTWRGNIWSISISGAMHNPIFGQGAGFFPVIGGTRGATFTYWSAHNQFLAWFTIGGIVLLVASIAVIARAVRGASNAPEGVRLPAVKYLVAAAVLFVLEAQFDWGGANLIAFTILPLLVLQRQEARVEADETDEDQMCSTGSKVGK